MANFTINKVTALPGVLVANAMYLVTDAAGDFMELYVTNSAGAATRRTPTKTDIETWIAASVSSLGAIEVVDDIPARNALVLTANAQVLVLDASSAVNVDAGAATYVYRHSDTSWHKISEAESMDVVLAWANITGIPAPLPKIGEDGDGHMTYDGNALKISWDTNDW